MRIMLCCSELGLGHVSRIMPLGKKLRDKGHAVSFFSGGKAYQLLQKEFKSVHYCTPVVWYENSRGILVYASLMNILLPLPVFNTEKNKLEFKNANAMETVHRYYDLRRQIKRQKPDLIIVDGDIHALRLASRWKIPSVYITNIIRPSYDFSAIFYPGERIIERYLKYCQRIIIPDIPPPYTICEFNLGDLKTIGIGEKVDFVGSFIDTAPPGGSQEHIFKHAILREVTYESVILRLRRKYHNFAAEWLIEQSRERTRWQLGMIAEHLERHSSRRDSRQRAPRFRGVRCQ